jgi:hypothetical protein
MLPRQGTGPLARSQLLIHLITEWRMPTVDELWQMATDLYARGQSSIDPSTKRMLMTAADSYLMVVAEREGFEPPIPLRVCRISSAVHSTTLPPLQIIETAAQSVFRLIEKKTGCYPFATQSFRAPVYYVLQIAVNAGGGGG